MTLRQAQFLPEIRRFVLIFQRSMIRYNFRVLKYCISKVEIGLIALPQATLQLALYAVRQVLYRHLQLLITLLRLPLVFQSADEL